MKKKIVYIILCLFSLFVCNGVNAKVCTEEDIKNARATLTINSAESISIPSLGRMSTTGKANLYKMSLHMGSTSKRSFCMDGSKHAPSGITYRIDHPIGSGDGGTIYEWYKAYQYALDALNSDSISGDPDIRYFTAQAAIWILSKQGYSNASDFKSKIEKVTMEMYYSKNCVSLVNEASNYKYTNAEAFCNYAQNSTNESSIIYNMLTSLIKQNGITHLQMIIDGKVEYAKKYAQEYISYHKTYSGTLYVWKPVDGDYQPMIAPLNCDGGKEETSYSCVDSKGVTHDYTEEYKTCITNGGTKTTCKSELENKYCSSKDKKYIVKNTGSSAICTNTTPNVGSYHEYVEESDDGLAIPGKGEPEKVINSYCNLYCLENSAQQIFPGNVRPTVSAGTYIIWPTSTSTLSSKYKNQYPLYFSGQKTCYVVMAGEENTVNKTDINAVYNELVNNVKNAYGSYARRYYESSRTNGGCEYIYRNESGGACYSSYTNMNRAKAELDSFANSDAYKAALQEKTAVENNNKNLCEHDYCSEVDYYCTDSETNDASISCPIITSQCNSQKASGCVVGSTKTISSASQTALNRYEQLKKVYDDAASTYNSCQSEKNACNNYTNKVNQLIEFSNQIKACATYTPTCSGSSCDIYNYLTNVDLSWGDPEYGTTITDSQLEKSKNYNYETEQIRYITTNVDEKLSFNNIRNNTKTLINEVKSVTNDRKIKANVNVTYSLPTTTLLYNYVVKRSDSFKSQTEKPSSDSNYTTVGFSNLPISYNASTKEQYELRLSNVRFGDNGGQYNPSDYICNYNVTKTLPSDCLCPPGTKYAGKDLSSIMIDENKTCYEVQEKYCETTIEACPDGSKSSEMMSCMEKEDYFTCYDKNCRTSDKDKFCPDKPSINLSACLNNFSYDYCYNLLCTTGGDDDDGSDGYKCKNTIGADGPMDITTCVYTKMAQGLSKTDAINACDALICPLSGLRIIYRTISLENPFPSKTADSIVTQKGLKVGMFNDAILGRYPGTNWNDTNLVRNHILFVTRQGNKIDGSDIYKNEPLYRFELNTTTINAIRNYNKTRVENGGYADFTLECRINNAKACVSENFVHNTELSGLVGGVCMSSTSKTNFYQCSGDA